MDSPEYERRLQELERANQILQRKLDRTEAALDWLERTNAEKEALLKEIILEFRAAETETLASQDLSALVLENLPIGLIVKEVVESKYVVWNLASTRILGYTASEALGKTAYDLFPPAQADLFVRNDLELLTYPQVLTIPKAPILTKQGEAKTLQIRKTAILNGSSQSQYVLTLIEEITERQTGLYEQQQLDVPSKAQAPSLSSFESGELGPSASDPLTKIATLHL
ncbi:PAS domain S-box protein [Pantanalinema sp. GBBB05]|uniref:PAS domain S-box protein n=1 Tax=Pantanalinema sp. GBBB05 TaxID=2604139 RepID=UPI001DDE525C|nr:PAS domain S-box protein [Pantanalinema sp. GBBB05]